jgi:hypothetical protein
MPFIPEPFAYLWERDHRKTKAATELRENSCSLLWQRGAIPRHLSSGRTKSVGGDTAKQAVVLEEQAALREATERAERAEKEVARLKGEASTDENMPVSPDGETELRKDSMMAHLLDSLQAGQD